MSLLTNPVMALSGVRVLELAGLAPAPFCGMILSDYGASIIRIDKTGGTLDGDCLANGKRSLALNLKHPKGVEILRHLAKSSDVLIEPFRAGVMEKLGLGPKILLKDNPKLIYARLTGYGQTGPMAKAAGHDINYVGLSGLLSLFGRKDAKPTAPVNYAADFGGGGLICALGILLALLERQKSGLGQVVDSSMVEGTAYVGSWLYRSQIFPFWGKPRGENVLDSGVHFYDVYETKDGNYMTVGALEPQFYDNLLKGLGISENEAPQFGDFEESKELFRKKFLEKTRDEWWQIFSALDACVAPLLSLNEAPGNSHNAERQSFLGGVPKPAPVLSRTPGISCSSKPAPKIGEHSRMVLKDYGYKDADIQEFIDAGIIDCVNIAKI